MNFAVIREHREFFRKHHHIECEGLFSQGEVDKIAKGVESALVQRLKIKQQALSKVTPDEEFAVGRDLWRMDPSLKKVLLHRNLAEVAAELTEQKPLSFGYDMLLPGPKDGKNVTGRLCAFLDKTYTLNEMSAIQGVVCGGLLCISGPKDPGEAAGTIFPKVPGHVVFFAPGWPLPLSDLTLIEGGCYIMFVYVNAKAVYYRCEADPHLHDFRQLGYQFGDKLTDVLNPIVYQ